MKNKLTALLLTAILCFGLVVPVHAAEAEPFAGIREVQFCADWSDLNNFVNGGRSEFDMLLRSCLPEWLEYDVQTKERDVYYTFRFSFSSYEEYCDRMSELIGRQITALYSQENGLLLVESCTHYDLMGFLEAILLERGYLSEKAFDEIFHLTMGNITINEEVFDCEGSVSIRPQGSKVVMLSDLEVETKTEADNSYIRTILATISEEHCSVEDVAFLESCFENVGKTTHTEETPGLHQLKVTFNAKNREELEQNTMRCLNVPTFISERQIYVDPETVQVDRTEYFDLDTLLLEGGSFRYTFHHPEYFREVTSRNEKINILPASIESADSAFVEYSYVRGIQFHSIRMQTDMSKRLEKISRKITFTLPVEFAKACHSYVVEELQDSMCKGCRLDIYDEGSLRYYVISFSAWGYQNIEELTETVLSSSHHKLEMKRSWMPYGVCTLEETLVMDHILPNMIPADEITLEYTLPASAKLEKSVRKAAVSVDGNRVVFSIRSESQMELSFRQLSLVRLIIAILIFMAVLTALFFIIRAVRRTHKKTNTEAKSPLTPPTPASAQQAPTPVSQFTEQKDQMPKAPSKPTAPETVKKSLCPHCGKVLHPGRRFCPHCGKTVDP